MFMNAYEANTKSEEALRGIIEDEIRLAIQDGKFRFIIDKPVPDSIMSELRDKGYGIRHLSNEIEFSWTNVCKPEPDNESL